MELQNIEYLSNEVREVLSRPPSSATKWVFWISSTMIGLLLFAGFTFKLPEMIYGKIELSTAEAPYYINSPKTGILSDVKVREGEEVKKSQLIALFESDADVDDVLELENDLNRLRTLDEKEIRLFTPDPNLDLGQNLGVLYQDFLSALEFVPLVEGDPTNQDAIYSIILENEQLERSNMNLEYAVRSAERTKSATELSRRNFMENDLNRPGGSGTKGTKLLEYDQEIKKLDTEIADYKSEINRNIEKMRANNSRILQMKSNHKAGVQERIIDLNKTISQLRTAIANWKADNLIYAPAEGRVSFFTNTDKNTRLKKDEELFAIIPITDNTEYIGLVSIPIKGSGKVKEGQAVNLKFSNYPFIEFGVVKGTVQKIYPLAKDNTYSVEVSLQDGLKTTHGKTLDYYQQMKGDAEIITEDRLFIGRLFDKVSSVWGE